MGYFKVCVFTALQSQKCKIELLRQEMTYQEVLEVVRDLRMGQFVEAMPLHGGEPLILPKPLY